MGKRHLNQKHQEVTLPAGRVLAEDELKSGPGVGHNSWQRNFKHEGECRFRFQDCLRNDGIKIVTSADLIARR